MKTSESFIRVMEFTGFIFVIAIIISFFHKFKEKNLIGNASLGSHSERNFVLTRWAFSATMKTDIPSGCRFQCCLNTRQDRE